MNDFTNRNKFNIPNDRILFGTGLFGLARVYCIGRKHFKENKEQWVVISCYNLNAQNTMLNIANARFYCRKYFSGRDNCTMQQTRNTR